MGGGGGGLKKMVYSKKGKRREEHSVAIILTRIMYRYKQSPTVLDLKGASSLGYKTGMAGAPYITPEESQVHWGFSFSFMSVPCLPSWGCSPPPPFPGGKGKDEGEEM